MSLATSAILPVGSDRSFPSLSALRIAHNDLLKRQAAGGNTSDFLAAVEDFLQRGQQTGALLDSPESRWSAQSALDYWASALFRFGQREIDPILAEFDPALAPKLEDPLCPYVGLEAFQESQHELFFGRSRLIGEMVSCLKKNRLLAALGPSGSGKSSLLGGLLPALRSGELPGSESWHYLPPMVPGSEPLKNLARILLRSDIDPAKWISEEAARLERGPQELTRRVAEQSDQPTVLVIDQFEEVFTLCEDNGARQAFIGNLLDLLRAPEPQHRVILTMRSDYEPFVSRLQEFQAEFDRGQLRVTPLTAAELRDAIEKPAERIGLKFEEGVVPALLEDILGEPAGLPLLQFTLLKLWENRERNRITWAAYRRLGGGRLALARSADALYDNMIPENQVLLRRILLRLVRPGSGLEVVNNRIKKNSLYQLGHDPEKIDQVLERIIKGRLVRLTPGETPADTQIEIAHEALVRNWPRLVDWLEEARVEMTTRRRWESRAVEWMRLGRGQGGLLDEVQLIEAEHWLKSDAAKDFGYDEQLHAFVKASREEIDRAAKEKRRKVLLFWGVLVGVVLFSSGWAVFEWAAQQAKLGKEAQKRDDQKQVEEANRKVDEAHHKVDEAQHKVEEANSRFEEAERKVKEANDRLNNIKNREKSIEESVRGLMVTQDQARRESEEAVLEATKAMEQARSQADAVARQAREDKENAKKERDKTARDLEEARQRITTANNEFKRAQEQIKEHQEKLDNEFAAVLVGSQESITKDVMDIKKVLNQRMNLHAFRRNYRPVQPGTSISTASEKQSAGTLCCIVRDSAGQEYLLSRSRVFKGPASTPIVQPSSLEFGVMLEKRNVVAEVVRAGSNPNRSGAIARLASGIQAKPEIPGLGPIEGIADSVNVGTEVCLVGRGSGIKTGKIIRIDEDGTIVTDIIPALGDSGGPVLKKEQKTTKIIGMLWGWNVRGEESYVSPIRQVLKELDVELVVK